MIQNKGESIDPSCDNLIQDIIKEDEYLIQLVDTIPAQIYFDHDVQEKIKNERHSKMDKKAENLKRKFFDHAELSVKSKHKRARIDPLCHKSVSQVHEELNKKKKKKKNKKNGLLLPSASLTRAANIEELQKRLQAKIDDLQAKRKGCANKDPTMKKKLKTREKKLKQKKNVVLAKVNEAEMQTRNLPAKKKKPEEKAVYNKDGKIIYSKLDFSENGTEEEKKKSEFSGKQYKKLLKKAEGQKEKIEKLKEIDPEKANTIEKKEKWKKAILKSENVKIKDNPELLKKSLKKQEKIKKKKAKVWKDRVESTETRKKAKQEKRTKNIQKRKNDKLDHKIKRAKKKGRLIPGF